MNTKTLLGIVAACGAGIAAMTACGAETAEITPGDEGGLPTDEAGTADAEADAEEITDGGSNIDLDATDDAGDAAPCNAVANEATAINSSCISAIPPLPGGALVAGKYYLTAVSALGSRPFCQNLFQPVSFKETMVLTVDANGTGTADAILQLATQAPRTTTSTIDPGPGDTSPAMGAGVCPPRGMGNLRYFSGVRNNVQVLAITGAYGQGAAIYRFERQP
jgi:hypothetical protein